jgi:hypothetical protein
MKNLFKLFGIIALVAVIGFSMVACGGDDDNGGGGGGGGVTVPAWAQGTWHSAPPSAPAGRYKAAEITSTQFRMFTINNSTNPAMTFNCTDVTGTIVTFAGSGQTYKVRQTTDPDVIEYESSVQVGVWGSYYK